MNRQAFVTAVLAALAVVLAALGALCGSVFGVATDETLYGGQSRAAVAQMLDTQQDEAVTAYIGLDAEQQQEVAQSLALYMEMGGELPQTLHLFNERERAHLADVRDWMAVCGTARTLCISVAAALAVVVAWTGASLAHPRRSVLAGAAGGVCVLALIAVILLLGMRTAGFARLFVGMHELLFDNDLWLLNPETDVLIRMMPQTLFERAFEAVCLQAGRVFAVVLVLLGAVYAVMSGMIGRHLSNQRAQASSGTPGGKTGFTE